MDARMIRKRTEWALVSQILIAILFLSWQGGIHFLLGQSTTAPQDQRIFQMVHTSWTIRDGVPEFVNASEQTKDGTLWLGGRDGLYSFDGIKFTLSNLVPRKDVGYLEGTRTGDLWVIGNNIPPTRIRNGAVEVFDKADDGSVGAFTWIVESADGTIWAELNTKSLVRLGSNGIWQRVPGPKPDLDRLGALFFDSSDTQWIVADDLLYRRARDEQTFKPTHVEVNTLGGFITLVEGSDRSIWIGDGTLKHIDRFGNPLPNVTSADDIGSIVMAEDGSLWINHNKGGIQRLSPTELAGKNRRPGEAAPDIYGRADGLKTTGLRALLRDKDGEIWVFWAHGLEKFQYSTMVPVSPYPSNAWWYSFCLTPNGDAWVGGIDGFLGSVRRDQFFRFKDGPLISSISCSADGRVRLMTVQGIAEPQGRRLKFLPVLLNHGPYWERYRFSGLAVLPDGGLIASTKGSSENGLWEYRDGAWRPFLPSVGIQNINALLLDRAGNHLYLAWNNGTIVALNSHTWAKESMSSTQIGVIDGLAETQYGVFAYGINGIAIEHGGTFRMLQFANPDLATSVTGVAEDRVGDLWINGSRAIARVRASEIAEAISQPEHKIVAQEFREGDFHGSDIFYLSRNSTQVDPQGRVWFATSNGIIYIDPAHLDRASRPPTLSIRSVTADGRTVNADAKIDSGTQTLDVQYFGLNLVNPSSVVYRYRLQGYDPEWQNVGNRTEAIYTHLRPGRYTFQVAASNGDGRWTAPVSSAPFVVLPHFYETWWFESLCILLTGFTIWLGLTMRVRFVAERIKMRAEERANERIRIARELHDTLLQGVQGLLMSFHAAAQKIPATHESRLALEKALASADHVILEGRDRVNRLRSNRSPVEELEAAIQELADDLAALSRPEFALERTGTQHALNPEVSEEVYYIAREALTNSYRHSGATRVVAAVDYGKRGLRLELRDNGKGFDKRLLEESETNGHWGFRGMDERAQRIGADFSYRSAPGEGTQVTVVVPASRAYADRLSFHRFFKRIIELEKSK
jgi:signal transduction histidine kinase